MAAAPQPPDDSISKLIDKFIFAIGLEVKPATVAYYEQHLRPLRKLDKPTDGITLDDLRAIYAVLYSQRIRYADHPTRPAVAGELSPHTLHKYVRAWKRFFNWLVNEGILASNPASRLKLPRLPRTLPKDMAPDDLNRLLQAAQRESDRDYAIVCFLADTACRVGGLVSLSVDRLDLAGHRALVREKGDQTRIVHFGDRTAAALARYLARERPAKLVHLSRRGISTDRIFLGKGRYGSLTGAGVYRALKRLARKAGVQGRSNPHSMRHAWARQALKRGADLKEIQEILGHASITTTANSYAIYLDEEIHERHAQLSWLPPEEEEE